MNKLLNDGNQIPEIALGVWRSHENTKDAVIQALKHGYRHIDTAAAYHNEEDVYKGIKESGVSREDLFITTKLWNEDIRQHRTREAFFESLERLHTNYVDLYLIHWPVDGYIDAYLEMEKLQKEGYIKSIGVSNFKKHHLENLIKHTNIVPAIDQMEFNPLMQDNEVYQYCKENHIQLEAWSPLGSGACLDHPVITELSKKYNRSNAQIILKWLLQKDIVILPKYVHEDRIKENIDLYTFKISHDDMVKMDQLNENKRTGSDPDNFNVIQAEVAHPL